MSSFKFFMQQFRCLKKKLDLENLYCFCRVRFSRKQRASVHSKLYNPTRKFYRFYLHHSDLHDFIIFYAHWYLPSHRISLKTSWSSFVVHDELSPLCKTSRSKTVISKKIRLFYCLGSMEVEDVSLAMCDLRMSKSDWTLALISS